jgi:hypothetical protein
LEAEMAAKMAWIEDIKEWTDGIDGEWQALLDDLPNGSRNRNMPGYTKSR